jgi:nitrogen regulatory protein P-II 1
MKLIKSIVRPNKVDDVREALERLNVAGMTVTDVRGHGRQKGHTAVYRGKEYSVSLIPKVEIDVVVPNDLAEAAVTAIVEAARTGEIGDGRVFVFPAEQGYNIRTGERDIS